MNGVEKGVRTLWWRTFDFYVRRVFAVVAMFVGLILTLVDIPTMFPGHMINVNGVPSSDLVERISSVALPLLIALFGLILFRAKPLPWLKWRISNNNP